MVVEEAFSEAGSGEMGTFDGGEEAIAAVQAAGSRKGSIQSQEKWGK